MLAAVLAWSAAQAAEPYLNGYRDCDLSHLAACKDSNQLRWGGAGKTKGEFDRAVTAFLNGAPRHYLSKFSWPAATVFLEAITGPGGAPETLPGGAIFFDGFTPHDAPDCAAIVFNSDGSIVAAATLLAGTNRPVADNTAYYAHLLTIYTRDTQLSPAVIARIKGWAKSTADGLYTYPGLPKDRFAGAVIFTGDAQNHWQEQTLEGPTGSPR